MQDLFSTDLSQKKCPTVHHADYTAPTRQHELAPADHADQGYIYLPGIYLSALTYADHQEEIDYLSDLL